MTVLLQTRPAFLRSKQRFTRQALLGYAYTAESKHIDKVEKKKPGAFWQKIGQNLATAAVVLSVLVLIVLAAPKIYYSVFTVETVPVQAQEAGTVLGGEFSPNLPEQKEEVSQYLPPKDETLPEGKWLIIPRIGVRTQLLETEDSEEALQKGVWKVPGYGDAGDTDLPMILAAHRYGWQWWWQTDYWKYNSFYLLPDTEPGDIVEIIDDQRKWTYEIYAGEEGDEILDYDADVILYTCKYLNSPVRHFRYARLIDPTVDSQAS